MSVIHPDLSAFFSGGDDILVLGLAVKFEAQSHFFCDQLYDFNATIDGVVNQFNARACTAPWPKRSGNGDFSTTVKIDDVDNFIYQQLGDSGFIPVTVNLYLFLESHLLAVGDNAVPVRILPFRAVGISFSNDVATLTCRRPDIVNKKFPKEVYDVTNYPGLR